MSIKLLDCTLRDGGHQNCSNFGESVISELISGISETNVEYIEIGLLRTENIGNNLAASDSLEDFEKRFCQKEYKGEIVVMIQEDQYPIDRLPTYSGGPIKRIRVSFHDYDKEEGIEYCKKVIDKGYHVSMNPINIAGYSDSEIIELLLAANEMGIDVFTVVDTFGALTKDDLLRLFLILDNNLRANISLGFHFHDNLQMAYTLAQTVEELESEKREIIIDGSLLGMGREPGNLCIELMMDHLNRKRSKHYDVDIALDLIDQYIQELKEKYPWGYETVYSLSAQYRVHRSYAEHLMKNQKLKTKHIRQILGQINDEHKTRYDEQYIIKLYESFVSTDIDDSDFRKKLKFEIGDKTVVVIAPGHSLVGLPGDVIDEVKKCFTISANFIPQFVDVDYVFCTNLKRMGMIANKLSNDRYAIGAFMKDDYPDIINLLNTNELGRFGEMYWDNCMLMLLHLLQCIGITSVDVIGWDGFSENSNFYDEKMESVYNYRDENIKVIRILKEFFGEMNINFVTRSIYEQEYR